MPSSADLSMDRLRCSPSGNLRIGCVRANLDVLRPSNLSKTPNVNGLEERFVGEGGENASAHIGREVLTPSVPSG